MIVALALMVGGSVPTAGAGERPHVIPLPDGFQPEGIATSGADSFYVGSIPSGAIRRGDLRTGAHSEFVPAREGRRRILNDPSGFYVNIHDTVRQGGAIRGQLDR